MTRAQVAAGPIARRSIEDIRGTNYFPSTTLSHTNSLGLLPLIGNYPLPYRDGFFTTSHTAEELSHLASNGINNIRLLGSFYGWLSNPRGYEDSLRALCRLCTQYGVSVTYIIWSGINAGGVNQVRGVIPHDNPYLHLENTAFAFSWTGVNQRLMAFHWNVSYLWNLYAPYRSVAPIPIPSNDVTLTFYAEPGDSALWSRGGFSAWPAPFRTLVLMYVGWLAKFFADDPDGRRAFFSYDLFNEPDNYFFRKPFLSKRRIFYDFIGITCRRLLSIHPEALTTVGFASFDASYNADLRRLHGVHQSYHSFHYYPGATAQIPMNIKDVRLANSASRVPLLCSEFWFSRLRGQLNQFLQALLLDGVPGQMWGFLQTNWYEPSGTTPIDIDGVVQPPPARTVTRISRLGPFSPLNASDLQAVRRWTATSGSRRWI